VDNHEDAGLTVAPVAPQGEVIPPDGLQAVTPALKAAIGAAETYARQAHAAETLRAYLHDWHEFQRWCATAGCPSLPADPVSVAGYLASLAPLLSRSALQRRLSAISFYHRLQGCAWSPSHPAIRTTLRGIGRIHGASHRKRPAAALTSVELKRLLAGCGDDLAGRRDRALFLLGFAGALRRSELVGIDHDHVRPTATGLRLLIPSSKTDAEGQGVEIGIPRGKQAATCPVRALNAWFAASGIGYGPVFRKVDQWGHVERDRLGPDGVRRILLRRAKQAGLTVHTTERLSPHGLRAGFVTEANAAGARDEQIMEHTRHRDLKTMRGYVRRGRLVTDSPVKLLDI
jgi:site-specific recombinase XerD